MNDAQVWTALGILAAALTGMITIVATLFVRMMRVEFARVHDRLDHLDRDVNALVRHIFGYDRGDA